MRMHEKLLGKQVAYNGNPFFIESVIVDENKAFAVLKTENGGCTYPAILDLIENARFKGEVLAIGANYSEDYVVTAHLDNGQMVVKPVGCKDRRRYLRDAIETPLAVLKEGYRYQINGIPCEITRVNSETLRLNIKFIGDTYSTICIPRIHTRRELTDLGILEIVGGVKIC